MPSPSDVAPLSSIPNRRTSGFSILQILDGAGLIELPPRRADAAGVPRLDLRAAGLIEGAEAALDLGLQGGLLHLKLPRPLTHLFLELLLSLVGPLHRTAHPELGGHPGAVNEQD